MDAFLNVWGLTLITFVPLVGAVLVMALPRHPGAVAQDGGAGHLAGHGAVRGAAAGPLQLSRAGDLQYVVDRPWIDVINSRYIMGIDGISLPLVLLTALIVPLCIVYSFGHFPEPRNPKAFLALLLVLETGMIGTFTAQDLILFFVFFEVVLLPMYFMIGVWGGENRRYAAIKFFLFTLFGSALMLVSFLAMFFLADGTIAGLEVARTFDMRALSGGATVAIARTSQLWIFAACSWDSASRADVPVPHVVAGRPHRGSHGGLGDPGGGAVEARHVRLRAGRHPDAARGGGGLGAGDRTAGGDRHHLRRAGVPGAARHETSHRLQFGGSHGVRDAWHRHPDTVGVNAAVFGMVAHGLITGMLFLPGRVGEGPLSHPRHVPAWGPPAAGAPHGWILGFCVMASLGLPGLAGFWGEFPAILASYNPAGILNEAVFRSYMVIAAIGTVLAAGYLLWMLQKTAFGTARKEFVGSPDVTDASPREYLAWAPAAGADRRAGFFPRLLHEATDPAVREVLQVEAVNGSPGDCLEVARGEDCFERLRRVGEQARGGG